MENRCFACMNKITTSNQICTHCGNDNKIIDFDPKFQLKPGTILREVFMVGLIIEHNGEGITYTAYDINEKKRVRIRELFPDRLCVRDQLGSVNVKLGCEIQFKSLKDDYAELSRQLIDFRSNNCLLRAKHLFVQNNTLYTVYDDVAGVTLTRYLIDCAGELSWDETEALFLPLIHTIKMLNSNGIIHRGIGPDTIIVTRNNELKLTGVCTSGVRAYNSELKPELYEGYAAPEQYQKCISYGEWTDVYSISAVLYKTLTGTMPPTVQVRDANSRITTPIQLNPNIPQAVSDAIVRGLAYNKSERTQQIKDFIGELYAAAPVQRSVIREVDEYIPVKKKKFRLPVWFIVILIAVPIMLGLLFLAYKFVLGPLDETTSSSDSAINAGVSSSDISSEPPSSAPQPSSESPSSEDVSNFAVDDFSGKDYEDTVALEFYKPMYVFSKKEQYHETVPLGKVISQNIEANSIVPLGAKIELTVSLGTQHVTIPPLVDGSGFGISVEDYKKYLTDNGLECVTEPIDSNTVPTGNIASLSVPVGTAVDREITKSVTIYVEY